jgi:hypothetical protein
MGLPISGGLALTITLAGLAVVIWNYLIVTPSLPCGETNDVNIFQHNQV